MFIKQRNNGRMWRGADVSAFNDTKICFKIIKKTVSPGLLDSKIGSKINQIITNKIFICILIY